MNMDELDDFLNNNDNSAPVSYNAKTVALDEKFFETDDNNIPNIENKNNYSIDEDFLNNDDNSAPICYNASQIKTVTFDEEFFETDDNKTTNIENKNNYSIDEDFLNNDEVNNNSNSEVKVNEFLDDSFLVTTTDTEKHTKHKNNSEISLKNNTTDGDFLSWLDTNDTTSNTIIQSSIDKKEIVDDFFDEVFGEDILKSKSITYSSGSNNELENQIQSIISSSFPDIDQLKIICVKAGYVPRKFRGKIWNLLLTNATTEDEEAEFWRPNGNEIEKMKQMLLDTNAAIEQVKDTIYEPSSMEQACIDMQEIILLYCIRRKIEYQSYFSDMLSPMIVSPYPFSRAIASSCFYALCTEFVSYITLPPAAYEKAMSKVHSWMRLLLWYHCPELAKHLDNVRLGWEIPAKQITLKEGINIKAQQQINADLDALERDLGLVDNETIPVSPHSTPEKAIRSTSYNELVNENGLISPGWMSALFGSTVPPVQTCWFWDWSIVMNDRYIGLFLSTSLFALYSNALCNMSSEEIVNWITSVSSGATDWFNLLPLNHRDANAKHLTWESFARGWLHAAVAMQQITPKGFREALNHTEEWASMQTEDDSSEHNSTDNTNESLPEHGVNAKILHAKAIVGSQGTKLLHSVKKFSKKLSGQNMYSSDEYDDEDGDGTYLQDKKKSALCLWVSAAEVIPCICSSQRNTGSSRDIVSYFESGAHWAPGTTEFGVEATGGEGCSYPCTSNISEPFYFGIDIRNETEMKLGRFPKAFSLNPQSLSDEYDMASFLDTIEPLAEKAHICLIGVGEEYIRCVMNSGGAAPYSTTIVNSILGYADEKSSNVVYNSPLVEAIAEYNRLVNEVAFFFMSKGFRHISILDGGFSAAAKYLLRVDSPFKLATALVDVHPPHLDRLLGSGTCESHLGARKGSYHSADNMGHASSGSNDGLGGFTMGLLGNLTPVGSAVGSFVASLGSANPKPTTSGAIDDNNGTKQVLEDLGKKISIFGSSTFASLKKSVAVVGGATATPAAGNTNASQNTSGRNESTWKTVSDSTPKSSGSGSSGPTFVIDDDDEDSTQEPSSPESTASPATDTIKEEVVVKKQSFVESIPDTDRVAISRTDAEKNQALAMHKLAGLRKGDKITISREHLPGALLFPATKEKAFTDESGNIVYESESKSENTEDRKPVMQIVHRFLVVTRERFIVLDSGGKGVGSEGVVKSNHHLTELLKITFKKKSPDVVNLFISSPADPNGGERVRQYRVTKRKEFVEALQKNMVRFK